MSFSVEFRTYDIHSGARTIEWRLFDNHTGVEVEHGNQTVAAVQIDQVKHSQCYPCICYQQVKVNKYMFNSQTSK